jgi:TPP-dependent trihydroxycyclohexane-1,2-dione (THcHDO) dehydratase
MENKINIQTFDNTTYMCVILAAANNGFNYDTMFSELHTEEHIVSVQNKKYHKLHKLDSSIQKPL